MYKFVHKPAQVELQLDRPQLPYSEIFGPITAGGSPAQCTIHKKRPLQASLALLLTLHSHELLLTSLGFPDPITLFSSLGFISLPLIPYFLCLQYFGPAVALSHFSISYTANGYVISLFPDSFKPTCLFKVHLFISWTYDPLFLLLGPNGFAICLPILCCPYCWAFFFLLGFSKLTLNKDDTTSFS